MRRQSCGPREKDKPAHVVIHRVVVHVIVIHVVTAASAASALLRLLGRGGSLLRPRLDFIERLCQPGVRERGGLVLDTLLRKHRAAQDGFRWQDPNSRAGENALEGPLGR